MRVRVWIAGEEGPSRDFELVAPPRVGEGVSISIAGTFEEGVVTSVLWQLVGIEPAATDLVIGVEPIGSVAMVHVICHRSGDNGALSIEQSTEALTSETDKVIGT